MTHNKAFGLVTKLAPARAGDLWDTTHHTGCDTANAVADQYGEYEVATAISDLELLATGETPAGWERHGGD